MSLLNTIVFIIASVTLFLFGLQSFSKEVQHLSDGPLKKGLSFATKNRFVAALSGAFSTMLLQSSSAVSALAVTLTHTGLIHLKAVMAILIGANIGTASTAFIVSFKIQGVGAYFLVLGSLMSLLPIKQRVLGKTIFYFGFIFFALDQIGNALTPLYEEPFVLEWLQHSDFLPLGILAGTLLTALLQSSSVVTGLAVILAQQGLLSMPGAVAVVLGANIGTTSTALFASVSLGKTAKAAAYANFLYNGIGVVLVYPLIPTLTNISFTIANARPGLTVAFSHLIFNSLVAVLFLTLLTPLHRWLEEKILKQKLLIFTSKDDVKSK